MAFRFTPYSPVPSVLKICSRTQEPTRSTADPSTNPSGRDSNRGTHDGSLCAHAVPRHNFRYTNHAVARDGHERSWLHHAECRAGRAIHRRQTWFLRLTPTPATLPQSSVSYRVLLRFERHLLVANTPSCAELRHDIFNGLLGCGQLFSCTVHRPCTLDQPQLVRPFHLLFHAMRQLLDFFRLLQYIEGQNVFIRLVHVSF